jgi:hypothetical protein
MDPNEFDDLFETESGSATATVEAARPGTATETATAPSTTEGLAEPGGDDGLLAPAVTEYQVTTLPAAQLRVVKPAGGERHFNQKMARALAESIRTEGLHDPLITRKIAGEDAYEILAGDHRYYAMHHVLGWTEIPCYVRTFSDEEARMAKLATNAFRNPLTRAQFFAHVTEWRKLYEKRVPENFKIALPEPEPESQAGDPAPAAEPDKPAKRGRPTREEAGQKAKQKEARASAKAARQARKEAGADTGWIKTLAEMLGESERTAKRVSKVARSLGEHGEDDTRVFMGLEPFPPKGEVYEWADLPRDSRSAALTLVASGMAFGEALRQAKAQLQKDKPAETRKEEDLTDEEWLTTFCGGLMAHLKRPDRFKADAILYRRTRRGLAQLKKAHGKDIAEAKGKAGLFWAAVSKLIHLKHPNDWMACGTCGTTGVQGDKPCSQCLGTGYKLAQDFK